MKPDTESRCVYCGDPEPAAWLSCCGERHFEDVLICPDCGCDELYVTSGISSSGLEWSAHACPECAFVSDPE